MQVLKGGNAHLFRTVFDGTNHVLRDIFGMELVELTTRERKGIPSGIYNARTTNAAIVKELHLEINLDAGNASCCANGTSHEPIPWCFGHCLDWCRRHGWSDG